MTTFRHSHVFRLAAAWLTLCVLATVQRPCLAQTREADSASTARYFAAVMKGNAAAVQSYLRKGVPIDAKNELGLTGLHLAAYQGEEVVVHAILAALPSPPKETPKDRPLKFDEYLDSISFDTYLDESQRQGLLDAKTPQGMTAVHLAIGAIREQEMMYAGIVAAIVSAGADANQTDAQGRTPLHKAAGLGYPQVVTALLDGGADPSLKTNGGQTASQLTRDQQIRAMLAAAEARGQVRPTNNRPIQPLTKGEQGTDGNKARVILMDSDGQVREIDVESGGSVEGLNPAGMGLDWPPKRPGPFGVAPVEASKLYTLSPHQEALRKKLGFPNFFNILFIEDDLGTKVVNTRLEKWVYMRGGKVFTFVDGECAAIKDCQPPKDLPKTVIRYNPTQFIAGTTEEDVRKQFGQNQFRALSLGDQGFRSAGLNDLDFWSDGTVTLSFHRQRLVTVQAACRGLPKP